MDLDALEDQRKRDHSTAVAAGHIPRNFIQRPRDTVSSLLGRTTQQNQFKLEALTAELFEPLEGMLLQQKGEHLVGDSPLSLDCLVLGYLALALIPDLPSPWLRVAMLNKAPSLSGYVRRLRTRCFGDRDTHVADALTDQPVGPYPLPWKVPERVSLPKIGSTLFNTAADAIPVWKDFRANARLRQAAESSTSGLSELESETLGEYASQSKNDMYLSLAAGAVGLVAFVGYMAHAGLLSALFNRAEEEEEQEELGEYVYDPDQTADFLGGI